MGTDLPPTLWQAAGCEDCHGTGYIGRIAIIELLTIDSAFQPSVVNGLDMPAIDRLARERGFRSMFDNGLNKAQRGLTTLEEVLCATQQ